MAKRYSKEWRENVSKGLKNSQKNKDRHGNISLERRKKLSEWAIKSNKNRVYKKKPIAELKSPKQVRKRLVEDRGAICERCSWQEVNTFHDIIPVQVHHLDGNSENNDPGNLQILCPNCHSLTKNYMCFGRQPKKPNARTLKRYESYRNKGI